MAQPPGQAAPVALYPAECYQAVLAGRTFLRVNDASKVPFLRTYFQRLSEHASVALSGNDGSRLEFQIRQVEEEEAVDLKTGDETTWKGIKLTALKHGASTQERHEGYDPMHVLDATSQVRVRWVVKPLTPPPSTPDLISPAVSFDAVEWDRVFDKPWDLDRVGALDSGSVSPTNGGEAAACVSEYVKTNTPAPGGDATRVWWAVESAIQPDHPEACSSSFEAYRDSVEAYRATLRNARAQGRDTAPLRGPTDEYTQSLRDKRAENSQST